MKIRSLHGLRGLMAWWVVLGHVFVAVGWHVPLIERNTLAVDVFIILSGFVIAMLIERKAEPYGVYLIRRAFRLFPLYLVALGISVVLLPIQLAAWQSLVPTKSNLYRIELAQQALANLPLHLGTHLPLLQGLVPKAFGRDIPYTIIGQAWSISLEWQFYIVAPVLVVAMMNRKWLMAAAVALPFFILSPLFSDAFLGAKIALFGVGIATHFALKAAKRRELLTIIALCALIAIVTNGLKQVIPLPIWAMVIGSSVSPVHSLMHAPARILGSPLFFRMGEVSFSIYMLHMIPLYVSAYLCRASGLAGSTAHIIIVISTVVASYIAAVCAYTLIEKPGIDAGAWLTRRRDLAVS